MRKLALAFAIATCGLLAGSCASLSEDQCLAGDWAGDEGWLSDASLASAQRAAELVVRDTPAVTAREGVAAGAPSR